MSQKFPVNKFEWIEDTSQFLEDTVIKSYNKESDEGYFFNILKNCMNFIMIYIFYLK